VRAFSIPPAAEPICGAENFIQRREANRADPRYALHLQSDQHRIKWDAFHKRLGPIDRVDKPAEGIVLPCLLPKLLPHNGMARKVSLDLAADKFFGGTVRGSDGGLILLQVMLNPFVVMTERDAPSPISKLTGESEVGLEVH